jgi:signal peptidase II
LHYFFVSGLIVALDQALKNFMSSLLLLCEPGVCQSIQILPFFKLTLLHNTGAAFSFLADAGGWQRSFLVLVSSAVSLFLAGWLFRVYRQQPLLSWSLSLILGGAIGNLLDRAAQGYVVDFLVFYYDRFYFPAFNLADAAIFVGAVLLIVDMFINSEEHKN